MASKREVGSLSGQFPAAEGAVMWEATEIAPGVDLVITGVGKSNAAGAVTHATERRDYAVVLSAGIAGALPGCAVELAGAAVVRCATFADEGVEAETGFVDLHELGFPPIQGVGREFESSVVVRQQLASIGPACGVATVSTCSGTDHRAREIAARSGAWLEDMETAAIALCCLRQGVPWGGVRVVSNTTGDRSRQIWVMNDALETLGRVIGRALALLVPKGA